MVKVLVATNNRGKVRELAEIFADLKDGLLLPADLGITLDVAETGQTYAENARLKAMAFARASGVISMGDDSVQGVPGVGVAVGAGEDDDAEVELGCGGHPRTARHPRPAPGAVSLCHRGRSA